MQRYGWLLWTILPLLLFAGIWWLTTPRSDPTVPGMGFVGNERITGPAPTPVERADLQQKAENACRCARRPGPAGGRPCWQDFEQTLDRFPHNEMVAACVPLSTVALCFSDGNCITRDQGGGACTAEEARTIDAIWTQATRESGSSQQQSDRANQRVAAAIQSFIRGERVAVRRTSGGCSG